MDDWPLPALAINRIGLDVIMSAITLLMCVRMSIDGSFRGLYISKQSLCLLIALHVASSKTLCVRNRSIYIDNQATTGRQLVLMRHVRDICIIYSTHILCDPLWFLLLIVMPASVQFSLDLTLLLALILSPFSPYPLNFVSRKTIGEASGKKSGIIRPPVLKQNCLDKSNVVKLK